MARRILNRKELRADFDAAESRKDEEEREEDEEEAEDDDEEDEEDDEESEEEEEEDLDEDDDDEDAPKKKKKKKAKVAKPKAKAKPRARRTAKVVRMRVVWGVFNNSNQCVATYEYPRKGEAEQHAERLTSEKRNTHFIQQMKEPMEEKKDKEK